MQRLLKTWKAAGLAEIKMRTLALTWTFANCDDYWRTVRGLTPDRYRPAMAWLPSVRLGKKLPWLASAMRR
jgi:hypothetical protein